MDGRMSEKDKELQKYYQEVMAAINDTDWPETEEANERRRELVSVVDEIFESMR